MLIFLNIFAKGIISLPIIHQLNTDRELSEDEIMANAPNGARKIINMIKECSVERISTW